MNKPKETNNKIPSISNIKTECHSDCDIPGDTPDFNLNPKYFLVTPNTVRNQCITMLYKALITGLKERYKTYEGYSLHNEKHVALKIAINSEQSLFQKLKGTNNEYKAKIRSWVQNLKASDNPDLRNNLFDGIIDSREMGSMTIEQLASKQRRQENAELVQEYFNKAFVAVDNEAETDMFVCGKCKERKTKYYQLQTRSADEPMTTFITCTNCGNRWKF